MRPQPAGAVVNVDAAVQGYARTLAGRLVDELGEAAVRTVFLGGSVANGEVKWRAAGDPDSVDVYSDVDMYVVVNDDVDAGAARERVQAVIGNMPDPRGLRMVRRADVGVYTLEDLSAQPARPGTVDLGPHHITLHGDENIFAEIERSIGRDIDRREALYLIENRILELAGLEESTASAECIAEFFIHKVSADVGLAILVSHGRYATAAEKRIDSLRELATVDDHLSRDLERIAGSISALSSWHEGAREPAAADTVADVARLAVFWWGEIASRVLGDRRSGWGHLVARRCRSGDYTRNFREFVAMRKRLGVRRRRSILPGLHLARYAPVDSLRVATLIARAVEFDVADSRGRQEMDAVMAFVDRLTSTCGFADGPLDRRAREMCRAVS